MSPRRLSGLLLALLAACATGPDKPGRDLRPTATPSTVVAAELAFARLAQEKGQWTAFREYATDDAVMFVPQPVNARDWLRSQSDPAQAVRWQPHQVWSSCDGSLAVTRGAWQGVEGVTGYFTTVWQRQRDGSYMWVLDQGDTLAQPLAAPEMIQASVAECASLPAAAPAPGSVPPPAGGVVRREGVSEDRTLQWVVDIAPDYGRTLTVRRWTGSGYEDVLRGEVAAP
ncbi:hypothetical protein [Altericroceibacterium xinjiangense]|uniref:hypothetical protein n=1 Tax=Altericroceibacterium xinjiangense TaxID=762261 RepID=UPI000F7F0A57|nr:hypothetical protein [Altericroceibacterium xinjiangense]